MLKENDELRFNKSYCYFDRLVKYCVQHYSFTRDESCDIVQDSYIAFLDCLNDGKTIDNDNRYLKKIVDNKCKQNIKEKNKRNEFSFLQTEDLESCLERISQNSDNVENQFITDEKIEKVSFEIIKSLSDRDRSLFKKIYVEHKPLLDISNEGDISYPTLRKRHQRLKEKILNKIKEALFYL